MVVVEAAAITAGGIAAYKGGKAAATATVKTIKTKMKLSSQEKARTDQFNSRKEDRAERFAKINQYRESLKDDKKREDVLSGFEWGQSGGVGSSSKKVGSSSTGAPSTSTSGKKPFSSSTPWRP
ncbi:hypothetical protein HJC23_000878 [Cyclotella cryptica]|uniref:Uncharacterized protein n=1 Tax=Cyclotella cryptica TaxID=29204 RepID=A0ABD3PU71_9STRA|eukprot:CCRYP_011583-RA/>CCRYP_011583-RA protein AED:0.38 eAED:0.38 QI:0/-1/0/1/-1/1/1/0/123